VYSCLCVSVASLDLSISPHSPTKTIFANALHPY
jgi:hypothetical protein